MGEDNEEEDGGGRREGGGGGGMSRWESCPSCLGCSVTLIPKYNCSLPRCCSGDTRSFAGGRAFDDRDR